MQKEGASCYPHVQRLVRRSVATGGSFLLPARTKIGKTFRCNRRELPVTPTYKDWSDVPLQQEGASCYPHVQRLVRRSVATGGSFLLPPRTKIGQTFRCNRRELPVTPTYKDWSDVPLQQEGASCYPHVQRLVRRSVATGGSFLLPPRTNIGKTFRCNRRELPVTRTYKDWSDVPLQQEGASCYPHVQRLVRRSVATGGSFLLPPRTNIGKTFRCNRRELPVTPTYKYWSDVPLQQEGASCYPHVQILVRRSVATGGSFLLPPRTKIGQTFRCKRRERPVTPTYKDWSDVPLQKEGASCYPHVQRLVRRSVATGGSFLLPPPPHVQRLVRRSVAKGGSVLLPPRTKIGQTFRCKRRERPVTPTYKDWSDVPLQQEGASCYPHVQRLVRRSVATGRSFLLPPRTKIGQTFRCKWRELPVTPTYKDWLDVPLQQEGASCYPHVQRLVRCSVANGGSFLLPPRTKIGQTCKINNHS